ncbi:MAG: NUDIX hydrolase [Nakamurella sp.]
MSDRVRPTAVAVLFNADRSHHAVARFSPTTENPDGFHRLIGGGIEFGETSDQAIVREMLEELGVQLIDPVLVGVIEDIFSVDGRPGHIIAFVYTGSIPGDHIDPAGATFTDNGEPMWVEWRPVDDDQSAIPLYPAGVSATIRRSA